MVILCPIRRIRPQAYIKLKNKCKAIKVIRNQSTVDLSHVIHGPSPTPGGEGVFVLHGLLGSQRNWRSLSEKFAAHMKKPVIAVDARNHGDSPHSDEHNYIALSADVSRLISKLATQKNVVIGHSMGGRTGMVLALTEPTKVTSLIVVDISPIIMKTSTPIDYFPRLIKAMDGVDFTGSDSLHKARNIAKKQLAGLFDNEESIYFILMNIGKLPDNSIGWKCNVKSLGNNFPLIAGFPDMSGKTYDGPTLFIGGKLSHYLPPNDITGIKKLFPNAKLIYIEGAGHNVHSEDPKAFFNEVVRFLS